MARFPSSPVALETVTPAAVTALSVADVKAHINLDHAEDDALITSLIEAATEHAENFLNLAPIETEYRQTVDAFPLRGRAIVLVRGPLLSVTSITYLADDGLATSTLLAASEYRALAGQPARIGLGLDKSWPATASLEQSLAVVFKAGYGTTAASVPAAIKQAMKLMTGAWYEFREEIIAGAPINALPPPLAAQSLMYPLRTLPI